jgi:DNA-binding response OmpR family regulator
MQQALNQHQMHNRILAVDDEPDQLEMIRLFLQSEGFEVNTSSDGADALAKVGTVRPHLILVDASMPRMNGFTFCEAIRKNPATAKIPIIMVTGLHTHFARLNSLGHGANDFLMKPFVPNELLKKINALLHPSANSAVPRPA